MNGVFGGFLNLTTSWVISLELLINSPKLSCIPSEMFQRNLVVNTNYPSVSSLVRGPPTGIIPMAFLLACLIGEMSISVFSLTIGKSTDDLLTPNIEALGILREYLSSREIEALR